MPGREPGKGGRSGRSGRSGPGSKGALEDLVQFVIAYAKQETLDPVLQQLKSLGWGVGGAVLLATGTVLLALGFLRALQSEFGGASRASATAAYGAGTHLSGDLSWVPYMGGALFAVLVAVLCVLRLRRGGPTP